MVKSIDLTKVLRRHKNCWVALSSDERHVLAAARHPKQALKKAQAWGETDPILMWAPREQYAYIV